MARTVILFSLAVLCWGVELRGEDTKSATDSRPDAPQVDKSPLDAVKEGHRIRETVRDVVEKGLKRAEAAQHEMSAQLADCFLLQNEGEINLARFAIDHTQDERVRKFATRMIADHEALREKLKGFATHAEQIIGQTELPAATTLLDPIIPLPTDTPRLSIEGKRGGRVEVSASKVAAGSVSEDWFQLELKASRQSQVMTREMMEKLSGRQFDQAYLGSQIGMHIGLLSRLQAADEFGSSDFRQVLHDASMTVEEHQGHAVQLYHELLKETKLAQ